MKIPPRLGEERRREFSVDLWEEEMLKDAALFESVKERPPPRLKEAEI